MKARLIYLAIVLISIGVLFLFSKQASPKNNIEDALFLTAVFIGTITCLALAIGTLSSAGILVATRSAGFPIAVVSVLSEIDSKLKIILIIFSLIHLAMFSQRLLSSFTVDTGAEREDTFLLTTPISIDIWVTFGFVVAWAAIIQSINLIRGSNVPAGLGLAILPIIILALYIPYSLKIPLRRCVIVPHGIVIADYITMTDTVLLPLAKIKSIELEKKFDIKNVDANAAYTNSLTRLRNIIKITLNEKTDTLILRRKVNQSERINVNEIYLSLPQAKFFFSHFYKRFHKIEPEELTPSKEKIIEKQLGIETAPRSDAPLPSHKKRKRDAKS